MRRFSVALLLLAALATVVIADWTIGVTGNAVDVEGNVIQAAGTGWWQGLGLSSVWPLTSDAVDVVGAIDGTWTGSETYSASDGVTAARFDGSSYVGMGDNYDLGAGGLAYGGWFWYENGSAHVASLMGKGDGGASADGHYYLYRNVNLIRVDSMTDTDSGSAATFANAQTNQWVFVAAIIARAGTNLTTAIVVNTNAPVTSSAKITSATFDTAVNFRVAANSGGNRKIVGWARDCWTKVNGTTTDCSAVYNATKATYGK